LLGGGTLRDARRWRTAASEFALRLLPFAAADALATARRVLILPHDVLWRVPFEALPAGDQYLGERTAVSYVGSYQAVLHPESREQLAALEVTAVGASVLADELIKQLQQTA